MHRIESISSFSSLPMDLQEDTTLGENMNVSNKLKSGYVELPRKSWKCSIENGEKQNGHLRPSETRWICKKDSNFVEKGSVVCIQAEY